MEKYIKNQILNSYKVKKALYLDKITIKLISTVCEKIIFAFKSGNKIMLAGNGGSAADAQHIAGELVSRFSFDRPGLPAIALTTNTSIITGIGNDYGYDRLFARQLKTHGINGDIFIAISTSGNSLNILNAIKECNKKGIISIGLTGQSGGELLNYCEFCIKIPTTDTPRIQESHILIGHIICSVVEEALFGDIVVKKKDICNI